LGLPYGRWPSSWSGILCDVVWATGQPNEQDAPATPLAQLRQRPATAMDKRSAPSQAWFLNQVHQRWDDMLIRDILARMRHDGCGGRAGRAELLSASRACPAGLGSAVAERLLAVLELIVSLLGLLPKVAPDRRDKDSLAAACERLWCLRRAGVARPCSATRRMAGHQRCRGTTSGRVVRQLPGPRCGGWR
jgi:hypothetical protein